MPTDSLSNPLGTIPMNLLSKHWTIPSTNTLSTSVFTQPPTFITPTPQPSIFMIPTCAPVPFHVQTFDGTEYCAILKNFWMVLLRLVPTFNSVPNQQIQNSIALGRNEEWHLLLDVFVLHLVLTVSRKLILKAGLFFQQNSWSTLIVQPSKLKPKRKPKLVNSLLKKRVPFMLAVLKNQSISCGLNLSQIWKTVNMYKFSSKASHSN